MWIEELHQPRVAKWRHCQITYNSYVSRESSEVRICLLASNSHLRTQCMVCRWTYAFDSWQLLTCPGRPSRVLGCAGRVRTLQQRTCSQGVWWPGASLIGPSSEEGGIHSPHSNFHMQPTLRNSTIQCYLVWETTVKRDHLFWKTLFSHRLMFQCVSWPVIRDHLSWETTFLNHEVVSQTR